MKRIALGLLLASIVAPAVAWADALPNEPHVVVSGTARVTAIPDLLEMSLQISELDREVAVAATAVEERSAAFLKVLKSMGIEAKDIDSSALSMTPKYNWSRNEQQFTGTLVSRRVELTLRDLSKYPKLIAALIDAKIGQIESTVLKSSKEETLRRELLSKAVADARRQAERLLANEVEVVGSIHSISSGRPAHFAQDQYRVRGMLAEADAAPLSFEPGTLEFEHSVQVVFYLTH